MRPSPPLSLPMMSLFSTASITAASFLALAAASVLPMRPCSSPANETKASVLSNSYWLITRASSITAAVPLASSQAPGAGSSAFFSKSASVMLAVVLPGAPAPDPHPRPRPPPVPAPRGGPRRPRAQIQRIVVRAHYHHRLRHLLSRQDGHHVVQIHVLENTLPLLLHAELFEAHLQFRAVARHLIQYPGARRAHAMRRIVRIRHGIARAKALHLLQDGLDARLGDLPHHFLDLGVDTLILGGRKTGRKTACDTDSQSNSGKPARPFHD